MADYMETIGNALSSIGSGAMNALNSTASWLQDPKNQQLVSSMYAPWQQNANLATQGQMLSTQNQLASMQFQQAQEQQRMSDAMAQSALNVQVPGASQTRTIPGQTIPGAPIGPQPSPNSLGNIHPGGGALKPGMGSPSGGIIEPTQGLPQGPPPTPQNAAATSLMENMRANQAQTQIPPQVQTPVAPAVQAQGNMPDTQTPDTTETIPGEPTNPFLNWTRAHGIPDTDVQKNPGYYFLMFIQHYNRHRTVQV